MKKDKRVVVIADIHQSHVASATPPPYQLREVPGAEDESIQRRNKFAQIERKSWNWFSAKMKELQPIDLLIVNGDSIEGKGERSGGTELISADRKDQVDMAVLFIKEANAKNVRMIRGTGYHTGIDEDWEDLIAKELDCKIGDHEWYDVNGVTFDCKHFMGNSVVPYGRGTAISREAVWNMLWQERELQPKSDIIVRSHVHWSFDCQGVRPGQRLFVTPALQCLGGKFGGRRCSGTVDVGLIEFNISNKGDWGWKTHLMDMGFQAAIAERL